MPESSLQLNLDPNALVHFFKALERERRQMGGLGLASRIEPERQCNLIELVLSLNFDFGWGEVERMAEVALMTRMFAPLLAETQQAREALRRALESSPPGEFANPPPRQAHRFYENPDPDPEPVANPRPKLFLRNFIRQVAIATLVIAFLVLVYQGERWLSRRCFFGEQSACGPLAEGPVLKPREPFGGHPLFGVRHPSRRSWSTPTLNLFASLPGVWSKGTGR